MAVDHPAFADDEPYELFDAMLFIRTELSKPIGEIIFEGVDGRS